MSGASATVRLRQGSYRGRLAAGSVSFKGIPYARPPVGALRFAAPEPLADGDAISDATRFGPSCVQMRQNSRFSSSGRDARFSEDCLYLNVYTPACDSKRRAVLVWIHGGAFLSGSGNIYDGTHLAQQGDIVVVTINYRLGVFGFADIGAVCGEDVPSNLGLRDQLAALHWVQQNIAAFGGDPARVTIAGESAGSISVSLLLLTQGIGGLCRGAILQSGAFNLVHPPQVAARTADAYRTYLNAPSLAALRGLPVQTLLDAQPATSAMLNGSLTASPWFDNALLPADLAAARAMPTPPIALMAGFNRDETALFEKLPGMDIMRLDRPFLDAQVNRDLPRDRAAAIIEQYGRDPAENRRFATDIYFAASTRNVAERHAAHSPAWFYRFDYGHPWLGAAHALELLFLWNITGPIPALLRGGPLLGRRAALARDIRTAWVNFVRDLDPGAQWRPFSAERQDTMVFDLRSRMVQDPDRAARLAWGGADVTPRRI